MRNDIGDENKVNRPSLFWLLTEAGRAITELGVSAPFRKLFYQKNQGDGHPVLVLPGFMSTDISTKPLRKFIDKLGYTAYSWDLGRNTAKVKFLGELLNRLETIYKKEGRKISIVGWSLGGIYARQLAKANPDIVRQVITLGSPFKGIHQPNNVAWLHKLISKNKPLKETNPVLFEDIPLPAPVPTTAIFTKEDGIVPWQMCLEEEDDRHQNIQVRGSHFGLGVNLSVMEIIADRLLHTEEDWVYFEPTNVVKSLIFYPSL